jgi:hypothetical protein
LFCIHQEEQLFCNLQPKGRFPKFCRLHNLSALVV